MSAPTPLQSPLLNGFLRLPDVMAVVGLRRSSIYALIKTGKFPPPKKLTSHASGWDRAAISAWVDDPAGWSANKSTGAS